MARVWHVAATPEADPAYEPDDNEMRTPSHTPLFIALTALALTACGAPDTPDSNPPQSAAPPSADTTTPAAAPPPADTATATPPSDSTITAEGWGPLRIGMTRAEVVAAAGEDANPEAVGGPEPDACDQFRPERAPRGLLVMIERDRLTRISLSDGTGITTDRGFGVGDPAAAVKEAYGDAATVSPHKYVEAPAEYITVWTTPTTAGPDARGIVYEVGADGRVGHIHAGGPSIQYVEGCL